MPDGYRILCDDAVVLVTQMDTGSWRFDVRSNDGGSREASWTPTLAEAKRMASESYRWHYHCDHNGRCKPSYPSRVRWIRQAVSEISGQRIDQEGPNAGQPFPKPKAADQPKADESSALQAEVA